jgi:parallel beta-helix repeat protein
MFYTNDISLFRNNVVINNAAASYGGGICVRDYSNPVICYNLIAGNTANMAGGGAYIHDHSNPTFHNNTVVDNLGALRGGGMNIGLTSSPVIRNTILWGNATNNWGPGPQVHINTSSCQPSFVYSDIEGGQDSIANSQWIGEYRQNIDADPVFIDPEAGDYQIDGESPCVDAGDPDSCYMDPDGTCSDVGAYYFDHPIYIGDQPARIHQTLNIFPNPASSFILVELDHVPGELILSDITGNELQREKTINSIKLDVHTYPPGIYIVTFRTEGEVRTTKFVIAR